VSETINDLIKELDKEVYEAVKSEVKQSALAKAAKDWLRVEQDKKAKQLLFKLCAQEDEQIKALIENAVEGEVRYYMDSEVTRCINAVIKKRLEEIERKRKKSIGDQLEELITVEMVENYFPRLVELTHRRIDDSAHRILLRHCIQAAAKARVKAIVASAKEIGVKLGRSQLQRLQTAIEVELASNNYSRRTL